MKIQITVTETKVVDKTIQLPYYFEYSDFLYKVESEARVIRVSNCSYKCIATASKSTFESEIAKGTPIESKVFENAYNEVLDAVTKITSPSKAVAA
jgi:hypothetical protein